MPESPLWILGGVILLALVFDYINGFHDTANAIATVVSTRVLTPRQAVIMAGVLNFAGAFASTEVAKTVGSGIVDARLVRHQEVILAALVGAILWNLITWWWGLPSSSSHALVGGLVGSTLFYQGWDAVRWDGLMGKVVVPGLISPILGLVMGFSTMVALLWMVRRTSPYHVNKHFRRLQLASSAFMAFSHGTNDAQKAMGIVTLALFTAASTGVGGNLPFVASQQDFNVQWWVKALCAAAMGLGTAVGGWRIIRTMGVKMVKLQPIHGFAAETSASLTLMGAAHFGFPVSTTHAIACAIMGAGASRRLSAVRWGVAGRILWAWGLTIPAAALVAGLCFTAIRLMVPGL
ncbi:MAG TPA: inorganic phosphate transporter [Candidatus Nitrosotenuis sp.]|jgi:PiT family inorganic phosphate transporter|nr:inorganic phosphate transporter [Candidatus Nitrosotenuis sp.]